MSQRIDLAPEALADLTGKTQLLKSVTNVDKVKLYLETLSDAQVTNMLDYSKRNCLILAVRRNAEAVVSLLLERLARNASFINQKDIVECSALSYAAEFGHVAIVRLLLEAGADPRSRDHFGNTPVIWAAKRGRSDCLREFGRRVRSLEVWEIKGEDGLDARGWAEKKGHRSSAALIGHITLGLRPPCRPGPDFKSENPQAGGDSSYGSRSSSGDSIRRMLLARRQSLRELLASTEKGRQSSKEPERVVQTPSVKRELQRYEDELLLMRFQRISLPGQGYRTDRRLLEEPMKSGLHRAAARNTQTPMRLLTRMSLKVLSWAFATMGRIVLVPLIRIALGPVITSFLQRVTQLPSLPSIEAAEGQLPQLPSGPISNQSGDAPQDPVSHSIPLASNAEGVKRALVAYNLFASDGDIPYRMQALEVARTQLSLALRRLDFDVAENGRPTPENLVADLNAMIAESRIDEGDTSAVALGALEFCRLSPQQRSDLLSVVSQRLSLMGKPKLIVDQGFALANEELHGGSAYLFSNSPGDLDTDGGYMTRDLLRELERPGAMDAGLDALMERVVEAVKFESRQRANPRYRNLLSPGAQSQLMQ